MNLPNPDIKFAKSKGVDLPIMTVYLAGRIAGECIDKCLEWRHKIVDYYANYQGKGCYPIAFLDALNSKEADSIDAKGLTSAIPPNLIYDKDILSVKKADVVVAMMDDYMEVVIEDLLKIKFEEQEISEPKIGYKDAYFCLQERINNRRPNWGTDFEVAIAMYLGKPVILIAASERQKLMLERHPFMRRASVIVGSVEELLEKKWLQILYKSISGAIY